MSAPTFVRPLTAAEPAEIERHLGRSGDGRLVRLSASARFSMMLQYRCTLPFFRRW